jgi:hypothetical protein
VPAVDTAAIRCGTDCIRFRHLVAGRRVSAGDVGTLLSRRVIFPTEAETSASCVGGSGSWNPMFRGRPRVLPTREIELE